MNQAAAPPMDEEDRLLAQYGDDPSLVELDEAQKKEFLMSLWQIMRGFAELGFSVKSGDKLHENTETSFDDVLEYLIPVETAPETLAPNQSRKKKGAR
ncbi:hypothetical protein [Microbulbifer sp. S227A]|uniref:hypothetical protein n=1 Tax=Microbulbifer sp. S227A TaxID=3415131 RepID=UPI003C7B5EB0